MTKHKTTTEKCIVAGAYYRLLKSLSTHAVIEIYQNLDLTNKEIAELKRCLWKIDHWAEDIGFDKIAIGHVPNDELLHCFYGDPRVPARSDFDAVVKGSIMVILQGMLSEMEPSNGVN